MSCSFLSVAGRDRSVSSSAGREQLLQPLVALLPVLAGTGPASPRLPERLGPRWLSRAVARRVREINPAGSSTLRCREIAGWDIVERRRELGHGGLALREAREDRPPGGVREGPEHPVELVGASPSSSRHLDNFLLIERVSYSLPEGRVSTCPERKRGDRDERRADHGDTRATPGDHRAEVRRTLDMVVQVHLEPELLIQWLGPYGTETIIELMEIRDGGAGATSIAMRTATSSSTASSTARPRPTASCRPSSTRARSPPCRP